MKTFRLLWKGGYMSIQKELISRRGTGRTTYQLLQMLKMMESGRHDNVVYFSIHYASAQYNMRYFITLLGQAKVAYTVRKSAMTVMLDNGSKVVFCSNQSSNEFRGLNITPIDDHSVIEDEMLMLQHTYEDMFEHFTPRTATWRENYGE